MISSNIHKEKNKIREYIKNINLNDFTDLQNNLSSENKLDSFDKSLRESEIISPGNSSIDSNYSFDSKEITTIKENFNNDFDLIDLNEIIAYENNERETFNLIKDKNYNNKKKDLNFVEKEKRYFSLISNLNISKK
jgi:hypothetical protein